MDLPASDRQMVVVEGCAAAHTSEHVRADGRVMGVASHKGACNPWCHNIGEGIATGVNKQQGFHCTQSFPC
jgi:hypothetical protein